MFEKSVALIRTMRPMTWISVMLTIFAGMMISLGEVPSLDDTIFIAGLLPIFVLGYANSLNAYTDYKIDEITRPQRAIPKGILKKETVLYFSIFLFIGAIFISLFVLSLFLSLFVVAGLVLSTAYSARPTRIKAQSAAAPIAIAAGYVFIPLVGASLLYSGIHGDVVFIAVVLTAQTAGASISKDFIDMKGDSALNIKTIPLILGVKKARLMVISALAVPLAVFSVVSYAGFLPKPFLIYLVLMPWLFFIGSLLKNESTYEKAYITCFFFCAASILLSGVAYIS